MTFLLLKKEFYLLGTTAISKLSCIYYTYLSIYFTKTTSSLFMVFDSSLKIICLTNIILAALFTSQNI